MVRHDVSVITSVGALLRVETASAPNRWQARSSCYVIFIGDAEDMGQWELLRGYENAFGERHADIEALYSSRYVCLHLYPGGARRLAA